MLGLLGMEGRKTLLRAILAFNAADMAHQLTTVSALLVLGLHVGSAELSGACLTLAEQ